MTDEDRRRKDHTLTVDLAGVAANGAKVLAHAGDFDFPVFRDKYLHSLYWHYAGMCRWVVERNRNHG